MAEPNISSRSFIQWPPEESSEPTSTLVLTAPSGRFVDLRILEASPDKRDTITLPLERLDWAIGGISVSEWRQDVRHSTWHHVVDSRHAEHPELAKDEGDMVADSKDAKLTLEYGEMVNPATGVLQKYIEGWLDGDAMAVDGESMKRCIVLTTGSWPSPKDVKEDPMAASGSGGEPKGIIVRIGQHCQGLLRSGQDLALERWAWKGQDSSVEAKGAWEKEIQMGNLQIPSKLAMHTDESWKDGQEIKDDDKVWTVREVLSW